MNIVLIIKNSFVALSNFAPFTLVYLCFPFVFCSCENGETNVLKTELKQLNEKVNALQASQDELKSLSEDFQSVKQLLAKTNTGEAPIVSAKYSLTIHGKNDPFIGPKDSDVVVIVFIDFQCIPCRRFYESSFKRIKEDFVDTKKLKFIIRDFPLSSNPQALPGAVMANCAGEQGLYWQMFETLFRESKKVDSGELTEAAKLVSDVNLEKLKLCIESNRYEKEITEDILEGQTLGAKGAPSIFVGKRETGDDFSGVFIRGAQPYVVISAEIEKLFGTPILNP